MIQSLLAVCLSVETMPVWSPDYPVSSFPMAIVSMHTAECQ